MSQVSVTINGRQFRMACEDGQEGHLMNLARDLDTRIEGLRKKIDDLDMRLVELINQRAECAIQIGRLKRNSAMPIYEPDREKIIYGNIARNNSGQLSDIQLRQVYGRLIDVMRQIQRDEMVPEASAQLGRAELEPKD